jgi:DHA1 family inner membrane transport protein
MLRAASIAAMEQAPRAPRRVLPAIVLAQLLGTAPWFAVNAVMPQLRADYGWPASALATLSSAIQWGFIAGTLVFALLALADRHSARRVFLICALAAAGCTLASAAFASNYAALIGWRAATGFFLAGIYPVGMKLAALWFPRGLGAALGWLIGALVVGSASAHALRAISLGGAGDAPWAVVFVGVALAAALAGVLVIVLVPEPAHAAAPASGLRLGALGRIWADRRLRASVFGYFGHMVELYTLWVLVPLILATRLVGAATLSWWSFGVLAAGALGCVGGGLLAQRWGSARVAAVQLAVSGACCFAAPWLLGAPLAIFLAWMVLWGITVAGDSPQFSALTASNAPRDAVGSVLTLVNSIGFAISALSIEFFVRWAQHAPLAQVLPWVGLGPVVGLLMLRPLLRPTETPLRQSS